MNSEKTVPQDTKQIFAQCGACSHTFFYLLNREFGYPKDAEERASDVLAGGLMNGHQCGMLWGSALAVGAESYRRNYDRGQAVAISATQRLVDSFSRRAGSVNCRDIVGCDLSDRFGIAKLLLKMLLQGGMNNSVCFNLAEAWAPEAIQSAADGLSCEEPDCGQAPVSCAAEVARKMGASDEELVTVAGLAGGIGLSGNACGALGAAFWMNTLAWCREHPGETPPSYNRMNTTRLLTAFKAATGGEFLCREIVGRRFESVSDHSEYIRNGGCGALIGLLAAEGMSWKASR